MRIIAAAFIAFILISHSGCKKDRGVDEYDESDLYGTWVKGSNFGDTLWFMKKNGQFVMRIATSFNSSMPGYVEKEYRLRDGTLSIKSFAPVSQEYFSINSFNWVDRGKEFTITSTDLFLAISFMGTYTYRKI